jgi:hypothetical protein
MATTATAPRPTDTDYEIPLVHLKVSERVGNTAFWLGVTGAVVAGAVDLPVAALIAAGVVLVRHQSGAR